MRARIPPPQADGAPLHVGQLNLPPAAEFREMFEGIFARRFFANHGPLEHQLDDALAAYFGVRHAVSVVNATTALMMLWRALVPQSATGREVIVPSFTFPASVQALEWAGLKPIFCDVAPETHMLSAPLVAEKIGPATAAILGVHVWGRGCDPTNLETLASRHGLKLAFDAAHAIGCTVRGRRIGGFGDAEVFSFHATKILNGAEGGCIATDDDQLAETLRAMRSFHDGGTAGGAFRLNAKISEAQAAMALLGLRHLDGLIEENRHRYELYRHGLRNVPGLQFLDYAAGEESNYQFIVASISPTELGMTRDDLLDGLQARGILARRYFSPGIHRTSPFRDGEVPDLPVTDHLCRTLLQLPTGQAVSDGDVAAVCAAVHTLAGTVTP